MAYREEARKGGTYAVVLVGGKGKRLRPLSTDTVPKAFLSITKNRKTMFANTVDRITRIIPRDHVVVVANALHSRLVKKDLPEIGRNLVLEPESRNTAPAVTLAGRLIFERDEDAVIVMLPTDHYILDEGKQLACLGKAIDFARTHGGVTMVLGLKPTFPSTQFGYIELKRQYPARDVWKVARFVEKPDLVTAKRYVKSGKFLWNTGIFIFKARTLLASVKKYAPKVYNGLEGKKDLRRAYLKLPDISLDYAVMEHAKNIYCVKGAYGWNDVGSFEALKKVLKRESRKYTEEDGKITKIL